MPWSELALACIVALWATLGVAPALATLIATRGRALAAVPLAAAAGIAGGVLVPLVRDDGAGFVASLIVALVAGAIVASASLSRDRRLKPAA